MLITGDAGYIGTHLRKFFPDAEGCDLKNGEDYRSIYDREFDVVVHLAATVSVMRALEEPLQCFQNNAVGLAMFLASNKVGRFVFLSTCGIYGNAHFAGEGDVRWENCLNPYAQSKLLGENAIRESESQHIGSHVILRLANVYGGDYSERGEAAVHPNFEKDNPIVVYGGTQTRDFVHIDTVCQAIRTAVEGGMNGTYNIGSGRETQISKLAEDYGLMRGVPVKYLSARAGETEYISLNCDRAMRDGLIQKTESEDTQFASK